MSYRYIAVIGYKITRPLIMSFETLEEIEETLSPEFGGMESLQIKDLKSCKIHKIFDRYEDYKSAKTAILDLKEPF